MFRFYEGSMKTCLNDLKGERAATQGKALTFDSVYELVVLEE
jgi:hypothetical protein